MIDYEHALNAAQLEAVTISEGPLLVIAGAGSGKTRTIVYRLAWLAEHGVWPESMLLLTFTRKAAREMLARAARLLGQKLNGVQGGTFHSFAYLALRCHRPHFLGDRPFTIMDNADMTAAISQCKDELKLGKGDRSFPKAQHIIGILSKARNKELTVEEVLRRDAFHLLPHAEALTELGEAYARFRHERALLDYDDLLFELEELIRSDETAAAKLRERFRHILVDEYQDTNLVQARLVRLLAGGREPGAGGGNVMAVGDDAQSIYAFRGANIRNILEFPKSFPGTRIIRLEENYRSTQPILNVANALLEQAAESFHKHLFTRREGGKSVRLVRPLSDFSQARLVVQRIRELLDAYPANEIAVLFRAGFQSYHLEMALSQAGIPFRKYGGRRYAEAAHVRDVLAFVRLIKNPLDVSAFERVASLHEGIGPKTARRLYDKTLSGDMPEWKKSFARYPAFWEDLCFLADLRQQNLSPDALLTATIEHYRPLLEAHFPDDWPRRQQGLDELTRMAADYTDVELFLADLALESPEEEEKDDDRTCVTLSTIHSAKGLEWRVVMIIDLVEDRFPSRHAAARAEDFEEERRLMYVACTRAQDQLELFAPLSVFSRAEQGAVTVSPSPFVRELPQESYEEWQESYGGLLSRREEAGTSPAFPEEAVSSAEAKAQPLSASQAGTMATSEKTACCQHKIFGRGKILRFLPPNKYQVHFPGLGLKVILADFLHIEE